VIRSGTLTALAAALLLGALPAAAQGVSLEGGDPALLELGAGGYDIIGQNDHSAGVFRGEYRFGSRLWVVDPLIGAEVTSNGGTYVYGGFALDIYFGNHWVLTPNEAVGFWSRGDHEAENLGSWVEFRSGAELDYRFDDHSRLGVSFHHISNAGLTQRNPGEEEVLVNWSIPLPGAP